VETNNAGEQVLKEVPKEGMVTAISMKDGKSQVVLEDGSRLDVNRIETVTNPAPKPEEKPNEGGGA
jgi:flagellar basal-body rod modification protein FlgD